MHHLGQPGNAPGPAEAEPASSEPRSARVLLVGPDGKPQRSICIGLRIASIVFQILTGLAAVGASVVATVSARQATRSAGAAVRSAALTESAYARTSRVFNLEHEPSVVISLDDNYASMLPNWDSLEPSVRVRNLGYGPAESCRIRMRVETDSATRVVELPALERQESTTLVVGQFAWHGVKPEIGVKFHIHVEATLVSPYSLRSFEGKETLLAEVIFVDNEKTGVTLRSPDRCVTRLAPVSGR